jgi:glycosyltransferase involved in cell wall biosynthesis
MPTCNRRLFVPFAVADFLRQDCAGIELLVLDDGTDAVGDLMPVDSRIRYIRLDRKHPIGAKRNIACEEARGDVIVHWDDDDWAAPWRVSHQVAALGAAGADLCGLEAVLFYEPAADRSWEYVYPRGGRPWVYGATLCYTKAFWRKNPFPQVSVGEDTRFVWASRAQRMLALPTNDFYVGLIHSGNTSPKRTGDSRWRAVDDAIMTARLGERREQYRRIVEAR